MVIFLILIFDLVGLNHSQKPSQDYVPRGTFLLL